jgi:hypothetical protein
MAQLARPKMFTYVGCVHGLALRTLACRCRGGLHLTVVVFRRTFH